MTPWTVACQAPLSMGILQVRILEWVAKHSSRGSSNPGIKPSSPEMQADSLSSEPPGKPIYTHTHTHTHTHIYLHVCIWLLYTSPYTYIHIYIYRLPWWCKSGKESVCQCKRHRFNPWVGKILWRRKCQPTSVFLPGKFHGQGSLEVYSP